MKMRLLLLLGSAAILGALSGSAGHAASAPSFANFAAPAPLGQDSGEPSIGVNSLECLLASAQKARADGRARWRFTVHFER